MDQTKQDKPNHDRDVSEAEIDARDAEFNAHDTNFGKSAESAKSMLINILLSTGQPIFLTTLQKCQPYAPELDVNESEFNVHAVEFDAEFRKTTDSTSTLPQFYDLPTTIKECPSSDNEEKLPDYKITDDWKMFWIIERKELNNLNALCLELKEKKRDIGMYFRQQMWMKVFTKEEAKDIKVYMCGVMDFCPVQHACNIDWIEGIKCLYDHNIGCNIQGCGLDTVNKERFMKYYKDL